MIIWVASYPRSGNTLFRMVLNHAYGTKTFSVYDDPAFDTLPGISDAVGHQRLPAPLELIAQAQQPYFVKTHNLPSDGRPAIYLVRDGRDTLVSYAHYVESFVPQRVLLRRTRSLLRLSNFSSILRDLILSRIWPGSWSEHVRQWTRREDLTLATRFEDLVKQPLACVGSAMRALGLDDELIRANDSLPSFEELHRRWPGFFRAGKTASWTHEMNSELQDLFWEKHGVIMTELGYGGRWEERLR